MTHRDTRVFYLDKRIANKSDNTVYWLLDRWELCDDQQGALLEMRLFWRARAQTRTDFLHLQICVPALGSST